MRRSSQNNKGTSHRSVQGAALAVVLFVLAAVFGTVSCSGNEKDASADVAYEQSSIQESDVDLSIVPETSSETEEASTLETMSAEPQTVAETAVETEIESSEEEQQAENPDTEQAQEQTEPEIQSESQTVEPETEISAPAAYTFRKAQYLTEHFQKHGAEFPYATEEEYLQGANRVINDPNALHKLEAEDGDDVYYLESTNEFVIVSTDGYIRTYFRPNGGIDYYNKQ